MEEFRTTVHATSDNTAQYMLCTYVPTNTIRTYDTLAFPLQQSWHKSLVLRYNTVPVLLTVFNGKAIINTAVIFL